MRRGAGRFDFMGHSWREMDPAGAERHDNAINAALALRDKVSAMPLALFTAADLPALMRVMKAEPHIGDAERLLNRRLP
jgi:hypothetical protein